MSLVDMVWKSLIGLFIDDEFLAIAIVLVVALTSVLILLVGVPPSWAEASFCLAALQR